MEASLANTGQVAGRIERLESVGDIVRETWDGCRRVLSEACERLSYEGDSP
jgi:enoyl-[acyl-carrier protein] reductase II